MSVSRLFHTLSWLRGDQIRGQLWHRLRGRLESPAAWTRRPVPPDPGRRWAPGVDFLPPGAQRNRAEDLRAGAFSFLNRCEGLGWPPRWENPDLSRLWEYNLHYFEWLWALPCQEARIVARDWISRHDLARGRVGWEPYPTSLRLVSWCAYFFGRHREETEADAALLDELWASIHLQAEWLAGHLELHLLGNHLLENAAALAFCGSCFNGPAARAWRERGLGVLAAELAEQVLPDGGHFERSPMYQARVVYLLATLAASRDPGLAQIVEKPLKSARAALGRLQHPDQDIALLNDSAFGIVNPPAELRAEPSAAGPFALRDTGYYGARTAEGHYVLCDAAPIGPDYIPGHAHGDIFSFELSLAGSRVLVDSGVHDYEAGEMRSYCRSTRAHNTVELDGEDQCEFWAAFRVARRGRPRDVVWEACGEGFRLEGWHDGYQRLPGRPRHRRRFRWHPEGLLLVRDVVTADRPVTARSRIHLHPACQIEETSGERVLVSHAGGAFSVHFEGGGELKVEPSLYCPEFGKKLESSALVYTARGSRVETGFCVANGAGSVGYDLASGAQADGSRYVW